MTNSYDRHGRVISVALGSATTSKTYNDAGNLIAESYAGGPLSGLSVTNGYDQYLRRTNLVALNSTTPLLQYFYSYGEASRLDTVSDGTNSATYSYLANSPLVEQITFANAGAVRMVTTKNFDFLNRLTKHRFGDKRHRHLKLCVQIQLCQSAHRCDQFDGAVVASALFRKYIENPNP